MTLPCITTKKENLSAIINDDGQEKRERVSDNPHLKIFGQEKGPLNRMTPKLQKDIQNFLHHHNLYKTIL